MQSTKWYLSFLLIALIAQAFDSPRLVFIQEVFRHGARYPLEVLSPKLDDLFASEEMSAGELTSQGRSMHYLLGKKMYDTYWKQLFAGTPYEFTYNQSRFLVRSTDVHRTIESAQSHLYGILESLPPLTLSQAQAKWSSPPYPGIQAKAGYVFGEKNKFYRPMAVHVDGETMTPTDNGDFLANFLKENCPSQATWMKQNNQSPAAQEIFKYPAFTQAIRELQAALELPSNTINMSNFHLYYENLNCMQFLGKEVPALIARPSETKRALDALQSLGAYITFYSNEKQLRTTATEFFSRTLRNIRDYMQNSSAPQWIIYSGHDVTLGNILAAMHLWNTDCIFDNFQRNVTDPYDCVTTYPSFATIMVIEVYEYPNRTFTFKVNYNGRYLQIPFCDYNKECPVTVMEKWFQGWRVEDVKLACGAFFKYRKEIVSSAVGSGLVVILVLLLHCVVPREAKRKFLKKIFGRKAKVSID